MVTGNVFNEFKRFLIKELTKSLPTIRAMEVGYDIGSHEYVGLLYTGNKPSKATINALVMMQEKRNKLDIDHDGL